MIALLLLALLPYEATSTDRVDLLEINHYYDANHEEPECKLLFTQLIVYRWCPRACRHQVLTWKLWKEMPRPVKDHRRGEYRLTWYDGDRLRVIHAKDFKETFTHHDIEFAEREFLPVDRRKGLSR